jgi:archaellum component FlaC
MADDIQIHERVTSLEGSMKTAFNRLGNIDSEIKDIRSENKVLSEMNKNIALMALNTENLSKEITTVKEDVKDLRDDVKVLEEKPAKRWDLLVTILITAVASGTVGYFISKVFGGG